MANKKGNDTAKDVKKAAQTTKKAANTAKKGKKLYKNSAFRRALPYIMIFLAIFLALCFIFINILEKDAIVLRYSQQLFCGLFGGAAYFLPVLLFFLGKFVGLLLRRFRVAGGLCGGFRGVILHLGSDNTDCLAQSFQ